MEVRHDLKRDVWGVVYRGHLLATWPTEAEAVAYAQGWEDGAKQTALERVAALEGALRTVEERAVRAERLLRMYT